MDQDLNNLLFQYAVAKGSIADPHDDDDFLVLGGGGLAASIADVYRCKPGDAYSFVKAWSDISKLYLSRAIPDTSEAKPHRSKAVRLGL